MPIFRFRLPSRNWMIFLSITGSFAAAVTYDRRQKKAVQQKWCNLVSHLASEPLSTNELRRKLTVVLSAPPGDSLSVSRRHFKEYIKPILVAASVDYELIEGRKEGEVRYGIAEQIRRKRRKLEGAPQKTDQVDVEDMLDEIRSKNGIMPEAGVEGDVVVGRQTWKEYIRGLHEGWLGPLEQPMRQPSQDPMATDPDKVSSEGAVEQKVPEDTVEASDQSSESSSTQSTPNNENATEQPHPPLAYLPVSSYGDSSLSSTTPSTFQPSALISHPHILGFLNTPVRIYRFLTQRYMADEIGEKVAAVVLGAAQPYGTLEHGSDVNDVIPTSQPQGEQVDLLQDEEVQWHKSVRKPKEDGSERVWLDDVILDPRISERMRKFVLPNDTKNAEQEN